MLEYIDEIKHEKLDYIRTLSKSDRNRIDYYKRKFKIGNYDSKVIAKQALRALRQANNRDRILANAQNYTIKHVVGTSEGVQK